MSGILSLPARKARLGVEKPTPSAALEFATSNNVSDVHKIAVLGDRFHSVVHRRHIKRIKFELMITNQ